MGYEPSEEEGQRPFTGPGTGQPSNGWVSGLYNAGSGAVTYGVGGLKWAVSSTASVGSSLYSIGSNGLNKFKAQPKHKDE